jgi:hypothetical protein
MVETAAPPRIMEVTYTGRRVGSLHLVESGPALSIHDGPYQGVIRDAYTRKDNKLKDYLRFVAEGGSPTITSGGAIEIEHIVDSEPLEEFVPANDPVNHPKHYTSHPSGIECIEIVRHMGFNLGNVVKYIWRDGLKDTEVELQDLKKALWYLQDEIAMREEKIS